MAALKHMSHATSTSILRAPRLRPAHAPSHCTHKYIFSPRRARFRECTFTRSYPGLDGGSIEGSIEGSINVS